MKTIVALGGLLAVVAAAPAAAVEDEDNTQTAGEDDPYAPDAVRCERVPVTGSRIRRVRVCMTNAEWAAQRDAGNRNATDILDNATRDHTQRN